MADGPGENGKRDGMARADAHANEEWKRVALISIREVARGKQYFTTDDVWAWMYAYYPNHTTHEHRAMGPRMREAAELGYCTKVQETFPSAMKICHSRDKRVWHSLIYRGPEPLHKLKPRKPLDPRKFDLFVDALTRLELFARDNA